MPPVQDWRIPPSTSATRHIPRYALDASRVCPVVPGRAPGASRLAPGGCLGNSSGCGTRTSDFKVMGLASYQLLQPAIKLHPDTGASQEHTTTLGGAAMDEPPADTGIKGKICVRTGFGPACHGHSLPAARPVGVQHAEKLHPKCKSARESRWIALFENKYSKKSCFVSNLPKKNVLMVSPPLPGRVTLRQLIRGATRCHRHAEWNRVHLFRHVDDYLGVAGPLSGTGFT